ncbi:MAG: PQQ-dependent sugar dehydrogenase [Thermoanaerobaculia bacterium]
MRNHGTLRPAGPLAFLLILLTLACAAPAEPRNPGGGLPIQRIKLPPGFSISVFSDQVRGARSMTLSPKGVLYVGTMGTGNVYALVDRNKDGKAEEVHTIASGLRSPNGVAWKDGALYVAEISRVLRFDGIDDKLASPPKPVVVIDTYPKDTHHGWKFIRFGPDGKLYVPVGAPCNVCDEKNPIYASITRISSQGGQPEIVARGIRNTVGFDWHPKTRELWFTENGRDWMGDDAPPDELNRAPKAGLHFGFPYCHAGTVADPEFGKGKPCAQYTPPARTLGPHVAALGMRFYTGTMFPEPYRNQIFIAEHGSWNRSQPIGYRVTLVRLQGDKAISYEPFAEGWLQGGDSWGRPVDLEILPDGSLLVSDDRAGAIYRITYAK